MVLKGIDEEPLVGAGEKKKAEIQRPVSRSPTSIWTDWSPKN
jgi:hypothetical protein